MYEWTEQDIIERWEEIASIREFDGGMTRTQAERAAYYDLKRVLGRFNVPKEIREKLKLAKDEK